MAGQCVFVEIRTGDSRHIQQNKMNVSFSEMARLIARNSSNNTEPGKIGWYVRKLCN